MIKLDAEHDGLTAFLLSCCPVLPALATLFRRARQLQLSSYIKPERAVTSATIWPNTAISSSSTFQVAAVSDILAVINHTSDLRTLVNLTPFHAALIWSLTKRFPELVWRRKAQIYTETAFQDLTRTLTQSLSLVFHSRAVKCPASVPSK